MSSSQIFEGTMRLFGASENAHRDPILLLVLLLAVAALMLAAHAFSVVNRRRGDRAEIAKFKERVDELTLLVDDLAGRLATSRIRIDKRTLYLEEKIKLLEEIEAKVRQLSKTADGRLDEATSYLEDRVTSLERNFENLGKPQATGAIFDDPNETAANSPLVAVTEPLTLELEDSAALSTEDEVSLYAALHQSRDAFTAKVRSLLKQKEHFGEATFYRALQDLLINVGFGNSASSVVARQLQHSSRPVSAIDERILLQVLEQSAAKIYNSEASAEIVPEAVNGLPKVVVVIGAQGSGKTSVCARLTRRFTRRGAQVLLASTSSRRGEHGPSVTKNRNIYLLREPLSAKPRTVAVKALHRAQDENYPIVILDTVSIAEPEGLKEVSEVLQMISREQPGAPHEVLLVVDAAQGRNAVQLRRQLEERMPITGLCVSKLDLGDKSAAVFDISSELKLPLRYISFGPGPGAFDAFSSQEFLSALLSPHDPEQSLDLNDFWSAPA